MIAAAIAAKNDQRMRDPWSLPNALWKTLTREQQKMWSDLGEASRVKNTKSGTPPFQVGKATKVNMVASTGEARAPPSPAAAIMPTNLPWWRSKSKDLWMS